MSDVFEDLEGVYQAALKRLAEVTATWEAHDKPLTALGSTGQEVEHPLSKLVRDSEAHVARLGRLVMPAKRPGRKPTAVLELASSRPDLRLRRRQVAGGPEQAG